MPQLVVLVKRKGSSRWEAAVKAKPGVGRRTLAKAVRRNLRPGFTAKIVSAGSLKRGGGSRFARRSGGRRRRMSPKARRAMLANLRKARRARRRR